ncbi:ABC transporter permease [Nocardioides marmoribigeumensis]|uniref:Ribose transport system permease protein n=1 Tax=Nocardioides marmoribigeumensis TaxID=433649 RepID=A0ABU2BXW4_9ACTN|nr:ABC transporter permease [Nocardioides marmoribigeumensis]MDR7363236.1 ribose transport system permease protein [Nocardioides marmoribigeumensis]
MTTLTIDRRAEWKRRLSFSNLSVVYILVALVVFFGVWKTDLFLTYDTFSGMLNQNAIQALMALSLIMALSSGVFDLSIGYVMSLTSMLTAYLVSPQYGNLLPSSAIAIALAVALLAGVVNAIVVVIFKIDSFIGTLATGSIFYSAAVYVTDNVPISVGTSTIRSLGSWNVASLGAPVFVVAVVMVVLWYLMGHTPTGRAVYATGLGPEAARLAGIRTKRIQFTSLLVSALVAGVAGVLATAKFSQGSAGVGAPYLIQAFAAVFLGATLFRGSLFNAVGTVIAVIMLGTITVGLALAGVVQQWVPYAFQGLILISALGLGGLRRRPKAPTAAEVEPAPSAEVPAQPDGVPTHV